ncbi:MAG: ABC transporter permease, partial [Bryobacteraceae bacterium]
MRRFGGNPAVLGQSFVLLGKRFHVAGIAQKGFSGVEPGYLTDIWISALSLVPERALQDPDSGWVMVWGRLREGASRERTQQALQATFTNFRRQLVRSQFQRGAPPVAIAAFLNAPLTLRPGARGHDSLFRWQFERPLWILSAFAGLLLLIACSNVANLFIAQAAAREREMAMRISIGAGRRRLMQQMLIESALIAGAACGLALAFASVVERAIVGVLAPTDFPIYLNLPLDWRVLTFSAAAGLLTALLFGSAPALRASAVRPDTMLKSGGFGGSSRIGALRPLLALQILFSVAVLFVADLLLLSFRKLTAVNLGFAKDGVILFTIEAKGLEGERARIAQLQLLDHVRRIPGVQGASFSGTGLIGGPYQWVVTPAIRLPGHELDRNGPRYLEVSPGFFDTMRIRMLRGRDLSPRDTGPNSPSVIVNQEFADRYFPRENPLGKRFELQGDDPKPAVQEIIGVVANAKYNNVREEARPTVYAPLRTLNGGTLNVRAAGNAVSVVGELRRRIEGMDSRIRVSGVALQSTRIDNTLVSERLLALISAFFASTALILAVVGMYGVMSYSSVRRTKEIGI